MMFLLSEMAFYSLRCKAVVDYAFLVGRDVITVFGAELHISNDGVF